MKQEPTVMAPPVAAADLPPAGRFGAFNRDMFHPANMPAEVGESVRKVEEHVRERPIATIMMAALGGFIIGRIIR